MDDPRARTFLETDLDPDPLRLFERWYDEAAKAVAFPEAMALATASAEGAPSLRMVLLKEFGERGFAFHTGYGSRKAGELEANPRAALLFYWHELGRQVRVEGEVARLDDAESDEYFRTRPRGGQIAAWASGQGRAIGGRQELDDAYTRYEAEFADGDVPRPPGWGGYRLRPAAFEFWQHRENRLHDRFRYLPSAAGALVGRAARALVPLENHFATVCCKVAQGWGRSSRRWSLRRRRLRAASPSTARSRRNGPPTIAPATVQAPTFSSEAAASRIVCSK